MVDLFDIKADTPNTCVARKRDWSVVPDNSGDGTDALIYKGSLKPMVRKSRVLPLQQTTGRHVMLAAD